MIETIKLWAVKSKKDGTIKKVFASRSQARQNKKATFKVVRVAVGSGTLTEIAGR